MQINWICLDTRYLMILLTIPSGLFGTRKQKYERFPFHLPFWQQRVDSTGQLVFIHLLIS